MRTTGANSRRPRPLPLRASLASLTGRSVLLLAGSTIATVCYALTIQAGLGLGPLFVLQQGFADHAGIAIGTSVTVLGFVSILIAVALRSWPGPGTLLLPIIGGVTLDWVLPDIPTIHGLVLRFSVVVAATVMMALGGAMMIRASVGVVGYDAVMLGLARVSGRPLAPIRLGMEATVLAVGWVLGGSVGVGTAITGLLIGPGLHFWVRILGGPRPLSFAVVVDGAEELDLGVAATVPLVP